MATKKEKQQEAWGKERVSGWNDECPQASVMRTGPWLQETAIAYIECP